MSWEKWRDALQTLTNIKMLKDYIDRRGFTYTDFANEIGINQVTVFRYLRGDLKIPGPVMYIVTHGICRDTNCKCIDS